MLGPLDSIVTMRERERGCEKDQFHEDDLRHTPYLMQKVKWVFPFSCFN